MIKAGTVTQIWVRTLEGSVAGKPVHFLTYGGCYIIDAGLSPSSNCHLQNHWIPHGQARCFNLHPEDAPPEWDPWAVKKMLQLSTASMSCGFGKPLMGGPLPHPRHPCQCKFCETPEQYWSWQKSMDVSAVGKNLPPQVMYRDSIFYQDREYMRHMNTLLAGVPISDEEKAEPKEYFELDR
ncbi:uncharacterized protein CIMG_11513 [Coccidioides immitis RS]|uniref:Uncharacterized protein n=1 Tax=Coccidioides immitis (strain RS) TaxID=246410 RepID=A0A0D8JW52_COCIM|nr:uncharacterized protein CIMG_11513 [Coccidioides immitis RS]KJF61141.1 hypothetical protein CIMG_11513 [Coccidioides immitis RS]